MPDLICQPLHHHCIQEALSWHEACCSLIINNFFPYLHGVAHQLEPPVLTWALHITLALGKSAPAHLFHDCVQQSVQKLHCSLSFSLSLSARYHTCTGLPSGPHALPLSIPFTAALTSSLLTLCISWITNRHPSLLPHLSLIFLHSPQSTPSNLFNTPPSLAGTFPPLSSIQTCCTSFPHRCKSFFSLLTETIQPFNE